MPNISSTGLTERKADTLYVKLNQSNPQSMTGKWGFIWDGPDTLQLSVNGTIVQSWTISAGSTGLSGTPMPFGGMLHLTYP